MYLILQYVLYIYAMQSLNIVMKIKIWSKKENTFLNYEPECSDNLSHHIIDSFPQITK